MPAPAIAERGSPPSTYCALALVEGQPGAVWRFMGAWLGRCFFIAPGLALAGYKGKELAIASMAASASISTVLILFYGYQHAKALSSGVPAPWENGWNIPTNAAPSPVLQTLMTQTAGVRGFRRR
jgi:hypothetical protein